MSSSLDQRSSIARRAISTHSVLMALVAHRLEHLLCKLRVPGSIPGWSIHFLNDIKYPLKNTFFFRFIQSEQQ